MSKKNEIKLLKNFNKKLENITLETIRNFQVAAQNGANTGKKNSSFSLGMPAKDKKKQKKS